MLPLVLEDWNYRNRKCDTPIVRMRVDVKVTKVMSQNESREL
jgi:hypothetical protein